MVVKLNHSNRGMRYTVDRTGREALDVVHGL